MVSSSIAVKGKSVKGGTGVRSEAIAVHLRSTEVCLLFTFRTQGFPHAIVASTPSSYIPGFGGDSGVGLMGLLEVESGIRQKSISPDVARGRQKLSLYMV